MSGGSMNYFYARLRDYAYELHDIELDEMMEDLCDLYHEREWYDSGDTGEGDWLEALKKFKTKWLGMSTEERTDRIVNKIRNEVEKSLGTYKSCQECARWVQRDDGASRYGDCPYCHGYSRHKEAVSCGHFVDKNDEK